VELLAARTVSDVDRRQGRFLEKPFTPEELAESVRAVLHGTG
jgi:DNA-binding response OmpR family regulator